MNCYFSFSLLLVFLSKLVGFRLPLFPASFNIYYKTIKFKYSNILILLNNMVIQIQITDEVWDYLNKQKLRGETFDEVLRRKLHIKGVHQNDTQNQNALEEMDSKKIH